MLMLGFNQNSPNYFKKEKIVKKLGKIFKQYNKKRQNNEKKTIILIN